MQKKRFLTVLARSVLKIYNPSRGTWAHRATLIISVALSTTLHYEAMNSGYQHLLYTACPMTSTQLSLVLIAPRAILTDGKIYVLTKSGVKVPVRPFQ